MIMENSPASNYEDTLNSQGHVCDPECYDSERPNFCRHCGIFLSRSLLKGDLDARVCRSELYSSVFYFANTFQVLQNMYAKQAPNRVYVENFKHGQTRKKMIQGAFELAEKLNFSPSTVSIAITFIDSILSHCETEPKQENLFGCLALILAAKIDENEKRIPKFKYVCHYLGEWCTEELLYNLEMTLFSAFGYNLSVKTSLDFATFFMSRGVVNVGEMGRAKLMGNLLSISELEGHCNDFLLTMRHLYEMNRFLPVVQASLGICCARNACGLSPWSDHLEEMTGFAWANLRPIFDFFVDQLHQSLSQLLPLLKMERIGTGRNGEIETLREVAGLRATKNGSKSRTNAIDKNKTSTDRQFSQEEKENLQNGQEPQIVRAETEQRRRTITRKRELSDRKPN